MAEVAELHAPTVPAPQAAVAQRQGVLDDRVRIAVEGVVIEPSAPAARFVLRGPERLLARVGDTFGVAPSTDACRAVARGPRSALWLGPDEWLLIAPPDEAARVALGIAEALVDTAHSLVEVSHRNVGILLRGRHAADVLNTGCPLDLDPGAFPVGMCTRTLFAKAEIVLWRTGPESFRAEVWRSFAPYIWGLLEEAVLEYKD
jgi:sarcosine oxidase subunit gamma